MEMYQRVRREISRVKEEAYNCTSEGTKGLVVYNDALNKGLGCVMIHHHRVITYTSRQ